MGHKLKQNKVVNSRTDFFYYMFRNILLFGVPLLITSGLALSHLSLHSSAIISDSEADNVTLTLSTSCTMSSSIIDAHTASLNGGQYENEIGNTKISTYCNDNNGYSIYAIGSSNNVDGNTDLVSSINDNYNIHTGIYDSSSTSSYTPSSWSMKLTPGLGTGINPDTGESITVTPPTIRNNYDSYSLVPENYTLVASRPSRTDMTLDTTASGSYFTTTYDIYASSFQSPGAYTGKVKYIMLHPYDSNDNINIEDAFALNGKNKVFIEGIGYYYAMQDMNSAICNATNVYNASSSTRLIDIRDNNLYYVTKLADGKCWMTQNLDLAIGSTNVPLTSENTDISTNASGSGIYASGYTENNGVWTWNPASTAITSSSIVNYSNNTVSNWNQNNTTPASAEAGDTYFYTSGNNNNDKRYDSLELCKKDHTEADCMHYHVGNYYNYTAAIASNASSGISADTAIAGNSICPRGWRLPYTSTTDNSYNEFGRLFYNSAYNITNNIAGSGNVGYKSGGFNALRTSPLWFVRSGGISSGTLYDPAVNGNYWSSTVASSSNAYGLVFSSSGIHPSYSGGRSYGWSLRCIAH